MWRRTRASGHHVRMPRMRRMPDNRTKLYESARENEPKYPHLNLWIYHMAQFFIASFAKVGDFLGMCRVCSPIHFHIKHSGPCPLDSRPNFRRVLKSDGVCGDIARLGEIELIAQIVQNLRSHACAKLPRIVTNV